VPLAYGRPPRAPWESIGGLTTLANAMIGPLGGYGLRGVAWYQGESNTGEPERYAALLGGLMTDWRGRFGASLPFLVVQLPGFGAPPTEPVASGWASLREAQRRAVSADSRAALVVTIDVGDRSELHPPNKQAVGRRLARAARHVAYGEAIVPSGPEAARARREAGRVVVEFDGVEGTLVTYSAGRPMGFELCGSDQASCRFADAVVQGDRVVIEGPDVAAATRVRFCWGEAPVCNLHDRSGLPAGPFELDIPGGPEREREP
jgi:sialate O-acetylesterase